jgi:hypothetical protein
MNSDPSDFEVLRKLMALKRHEQPPPGFFDRLPDNIIARLERGDGQLAFWEKFLAAFTFRPALAYGFALAAFSALTFSVINSVKTHPQESAQNPLNNRWRIGAPEEASASQFNSSEPLHVANWMGNIYPSNADSALPSLFGTRAHDHLVPVSVPVNFASP